MDELDLPENFKDSGMLSFRVTPRNDRIDVFVTKSEINKNLNLEDLSDFDDISKCLRRISLIPWRKPCVKKGMLQLWINWLKLKKEKKKTQQEKGETKEKRDYVHFVLDFPNIQQVINFAKTVDYDVEASELFKESDAYHMTVLLNLEDKPDYYADLMFARMLEHAGRGTKTRAYLLEHGVQLIKADALQELQMIG